MVDELVEPTEQVVPDQAEMFRQEVAPDPEPAPAAPEPAPEAEPELPPVEPDWLNEPAMPEPQWPQAAAPQYQYEQPRQEFSQRQSQVPPQPAGVDAALQSFVDNPIGWVDNILSQREQQLVGPIAQQQQQIAGMTAVLMNNYIAEGTSHADATIRKAYNVFNRDATFRADKAMQSTIKGTLQGMKQRAEYEARTTGNFAPLRALANLDETDMVATLAYMKSKAGRQSPGIAPLQVEGAVVESSRSTVAGQSVELSPDEEAAAERLGPGGRDRLIQAKKDQAKYSDLEWK